MLLVNFYYLFCSHVSIDHKEIFLKNRQENIFLFIWSTLSNHKKYKLCWQAIYVCMSSFTLFCNRFNNRIIGLNAYNIININNIIDRTVDCNVNIIDMFLPSKVFVSHKNIFLEETKQCKPIGNMHVLKLHPFHNAVPLLELRLGYSKL